MSNFLTKSLRNVTTNIGKVIPTNYFTDKRQNDAESLIKLIQYNALQYQIKAKSYLRITEWIDFALKLRYKLNIWLGSYHFKTLKSNLKNLKRHIRTVW